MLNELRDLDFNDIGSAPSSVRYFLLGVLLVIIQRIKVIQGYVKKQIQRIRQEAQIQSSPGQSMTQC